MFYVIISILYTSMVFISYILQIEVLVVGI